jgi:hypothetical protein
LIDRKEANQVATKRADQRRLQMSVTMSQALYDIIRDIAHQQGVSNSEVAVTAILAYLKAHYPLRATEAGL